MNPHPISRTVVLSFLSSEWVAGNGDDNSPVGMERTVRSAITVYYLVKVESRGQWDKDQHKHQHQRRDEPC